MSKQVALNWYVGKALTSELSDHSTQALACSEHDYVVNFLFSLSRSFISCTQLFGSLFVQGEHKQQYLFGSLTKITSGYSVQLLHFHLQFALSDQGVSCDLFSMASYNIPAVKGGEGILSGHFTYGLKGPHV